MPRIRRIESPIIDRLPNAGVRFQAPPIVDSLAPPIIDSLPPPVVNIPSYTPPSYTPLEPPTKPPAAAVGGVNTGSQTAQEEVEEDTRELAEQAAELATPPPAPIIPVERPEVEVPFIGTVPLPQQREVMLAGTTAIGATAAALIGKSMVEQLLKIMKPIVKKIMLKIKEKSGKQFTDFELQQFFEFEGKTPELKQVAKKLKKEQKTERTKQFEEGMQRLHQRKPRHKAKKDES